MNDGEEIGRGFVVWRENRCEVVEPIEEAVDPVAFAREGATYRPNDTDVGLAGYMARRTGGLDGRTVQRHRNLARVGR